MSNSSKIPYGNKTIALPNPTLPLSNSSKIPYGNKTAVGIVVNVF